jgi:hypothetical protein
MHNEFLTTDHESQEGDGKRRSNEYQRHPLAIQFGMPPLNERSPAFMERRRDIKKNGLHDPVVIHDGMVIDGWDNLRACRAENVEPKIKAFGGDDAEALDFIRSKNDLRKHMSYRQKLYLAARMVDAKAGGNRKSFKNNDIDVAGSATWSGRDLLSGQEITAEMAAAWRGVGVSAVEKAVPILKRAKDSPVWKEIERALILGTASLTIPKDRRNEIDVLIEKPVDEQRKIVASKEWKFGKLREVLAEEYRPKRQPMTLKARTGRLLERLESGDLIDLVETVVWTRLSEDHRARLAMFIGPWATEYEREHRP